MVSAIISTGTFRKIDSSFFQTHSIMSLIIMLLAITAATGLASMLQFADGHHVLDEIDVPSRPMRLSISDDGNAAVRLSSNNASALPSDTLPESLLSVSILGKPLVSIINTLTDNITKNIDTTAAVGGVFEVETITEKNKVYAAPFEGGQLGVYDLQSGRLLKAIELPNAQRTLPTPLADRLLDSVTLLTGGWSMDYNPNNQLLYVASYNTNQIVIVDTKTDSVVGTISGLPAHPITVKADPITNTVLVASLAGNKVSFISADSNRIEKIIDTGTAPWGMDLDSIEHYAYVTNRGSNFITVLDLIDQNVAAKIPIAAPAQAITVDDREHTIYTSYMEQGEILKIDGRTNSILSTIDTGLIPQDLAVDPNTHKLYASTKYNDKVYVMGPESISVTLPVIMVGGNVDGIAVSPFASVIGYIKAHGQDVQISEPYMDTNNKILSLMVSAPDGGQVTLSIPKTMFLLIGDEQQQQPQNDSTLILLIDGNPAKYNEESDLFSDGNREISFYVPPYSKSIQIIGMSRVQI
jgi:YVTN family beta-propeller protein